MSSSYSSELGYVSQGPFMFMCIFCFFSYCFIVTRWSGPDGIEA